MVNERFPEGWDNEQTIPLPARFFARAAGGYPRPPLAEMVLTGKGAATPRVRTYLWLHLLAGRGGDPVHYSTASWVRVLNLLPTSVRTWEDVAPEMERSAKRRFLRAVTHSVDQGWIDRPRRGVLRIQDPMTGQLWQPPSPEERRRYLLRRSEAIQEWGHNVTRTREWFEADPVEVPVGCFANGAIGVLSGAGLVTFLILLDIGAHNERRPMPYKRAVRYGLGYKPWHEGLAELQRLGWLDVRTEGMAGAVGTNHYRLRLARMRGNSHVKLGWADAWEPRVPANFA